MIDSITMKIMYTFVLLILISIMVFFPGHVVALENINKIYIDPSYGGDEYGPVFIKGHSSKIGTLAVAKKLKEYLNKKELQVSLSRNNDTHYSLEARLSKSMFSKSDIYISINISKSNKSCLMVYYPNIVHDSDEDITNRLGEALVEKIKQSVTLKSRFLARSIENKIKERAIIKCISASPKNNYLLDGSKIPIVIIDFSIKDKEEYYNIVKNKQQLDNLLDSVAVAIKEYTIQHCHSIDSIGTHQAER
jgi:N-acetylmuramoyl-L-alanine amidase